MQATTTTSRLGVTWVLLALMALASAMVVATPSAPDANPFAGTPHGILEPSMDAEATLAAVAKIDDGGAVVTELSDVRDIVLNGFTAGDGTGIDIALIDTGVAPVPGLTGPDVLHGPDLSIEGGVAELAYLDTYGHGTHMAGIIAGDRPDALGVAPGARIVSLKVSGHDGLTSVPQVVAAIDWVVEHKDRDGLNIRVLNLSLGQQGITTHIGDPVSAAVERAWEAGIFVVVAAGNEGESYEQLDSPAIDPYVMAVAAVDSLSADRRQYMDVPDWSAFGDGERNPDLGAAGVSIASYRVAGSTIDVAVPSARYGDGLFLGSGTSQAAAAVSGAAAALLSEHPSLSNDDVKLTLREGADKLKLDGKVHVGKGLIDTQDAHEDPKSGVQAWTPAAGPGTGIIPPTSDTWSGGAWTDADWTGSTWSGSTWSGGTWSGSGWSGSTWSGTTWSGSTWSGGTWSGGTWSGGTWSGGTWSGGTWSADGWS